MNLTARGAAPSADLSQSWLWDTVGEDSEALTPGRQSALFCIPPYPDMHIPTSPTMQTVAPSSFSRSMVKAGVDVGTRMVAGMPSFLAE